MNLFPLNKVLDFLIKGAKRFNVKTAPIQPGSKADLTLFNPDSHSIMKLENIYSTSTNGTTNEISCYGLSDGWVESQTEGGVETPNSLYQYFVHLFFLVDVELVFQKQQIVVLFLWCHS